MLSSTCTRRVNQQQVFKQILRTLSTTPTLNNVKPLAMGTSSDGQLGSAGTSDTSFVQNIAAEWDGAKQFSSIPGPTRFQMLRGYMKGGEFERLSLNDLLVTCRKKYGDTCLIPGSFGMPPLLSIFDPTDIERVHRTEGKYPVRPGAEVVGYYRERRKDGFFNETVGLVTSGKSWAHFRSTVNPVLMKPQNARLYLEPMQRVNSEFVEHIREIRDTVTHEVPGNFLDDINRLTFESVAVVALDKNLGLIRKKTNTAEAEQLFQSMHTFIKSNYDLGVKPSFYKYIRTPTYRRFEQAMDYIFDICKKYMDEALERVQDGGEGKSVLEKLLKIDHKVATKMAMDMLQAGVEPTSSALTGAMLLLAKNPVKQTKLREEIQNAVSKDESFTIENMNNLPYLRACIKESLRIYPITAGNFREAGMDIVLGGYQVPQGTRVIMNSNLLLSEERHFPRAKEFIPERWLRGDPERLVAENMNPFIYLPFGFGPRTCVGKRIVDLELELTLASLVRNFNIEFNHSTENAFECQFISVPAIPLKFKFSDL